MTTVMQEMLRCLDVRLEVFCFAKTHRPEEQAKLDAAHVRLRELQATYPASWRMLKRRLAHESARAQRIASYLEEVPHAS